MKNILFVNSCVRPESRTKRLSEKVLERLGGQVTELELQREGLRPLDKEQLEYRNALLEQSRMDDPMLRYADQFAKADEIVMAAPYWDLSFPSSLKVYLEHICVVGKTFAYTEDGRPYGLCRADRLIYVTTAGGPVFDHDLGYEYVKALCETFYGIPKVIRIGVDGLDMVAPKESEALVMKAMSAIEQDERL